MDKRLQLLEHLYGEVSDPQALKALLADPELREEFGHLEEVRDVLASGMGRTLPHAPKAAVDRVMQAALPRPRRVYMGRRLRPRRIVILAGALSAAAAIVALLILGSQPRDEVPEVAEVEHQADPDTVLKWDDTDDFIQVRQTLSVVRQRTSPQLWDESAVMSLDSIPANPAAALPGIHSVSINPRVP
ncbi:MAG: hypothetical protein OXU68_01100 [Bacteroidota bacterium]|nr:hypothetical protein [Bacteroidota bacterium]